MYLIIPVVPTGQQRPRFTARGKFGHAYKSSTQRANEREMRFYIDQQRPDEPMQGPLEVDIKAYLPIPKSWPRWKIAAAISGELRPDKKPDVDNLAKNALDCANGVLFEDDRQVVSIMARKFYGVNPRWEIGIREAV